MREITYKLFAVVILLCSQIQFAQQQYVDVDLLSSYEEYSEMERELVYAHLNKTIYIKGETIGIKAYVLDKYSKRLATEAANLYCTISNAEGQVIESKLLMVESGTAIGDFEINDDYTTGQYTVKLYTNWMRNFNENNLYIETIKIIDSEADKQQQAIASSNTIDAQFLPEGGHLLTDVVNTIGVVIKNDSGLGIPFIEGEIVDQNGVSVTNFKVNHLGIGKCVLNPNPGQTYTAKYKYNDEEYSEDIDDIKMEGITLSLSRLRDKVALSIKTNASTLPKISQKLYKLAIHNGQNLKIVDFKFGEKLDVIKVLANEDLFNGINIFTIFDADNNPLLERLYFNHNDVNLISSSNETTTINNDTITISLPYNAKYATGSNSFSVSVLPKNTNSFHHHNIASYTMLQPYVNGYIEQADYYFTDSTLKKQFELDNLLITQGWSSYDWNTIFNNPPSYDYDYENGISYTLNNQEKSDTQLMIYPSLNQSTRLISLTKDNSSYIASGLFPIDDEVIRIRKIGTGNDTKPNLYIQFDPIKIPELNSTMDLFETSENYMDSGATDIDLSNNLKNIEKLEEVVIKKKKEFTEIEKLKNRSLGKVDAMDEVLIRRYRTLIRYLRDQGWTVSDRQGKLEIYNNQMSGIKSTSVEVDKTTFETVNSGQIANTPRAKTLDDHSLFVQNAQTIPLVFLDGVVLHDDLTILRTLSLDQIEWIETNKSGVGGGMRSGSAGLIRIKTRPTSKIKVKPSIPFGTYEIPLKFSVAKKFYIPEYVSYDNSFFNTFGVIDWFPNIQLDETGHLNIKISNNQIKEFKIIVEGIMSDAFVSEIKTITLN